MRRGGSRIRARRDRGGGRRRGKCAHAIRPAIMNRRNAKAGGFTGAGIYGSETGFGESGPAISCSAKALPYRVLRQRACAKHRRSKRPAKAGALPESRALRRLSAYPALPWRVLRALACARRAQSLAVPSATREPSLTVTYGIPRAATERLACMSLCPTRRAPTHQALPESRALRRLTAYPALPWRVLRA